MHFSICIRNLKLSDSIYSIVAESDVHSCRHAELVSVSVFGVVSTDPETSSA
jgi:hypothetical protein